MNKIPTVFVRDMGRQPAMVVNEWVPGTEWERAVLQAGSEVETAGGKYVTPPALAECPHCGATASSGAIRLVAPLDVPQEAGMSHVECCRTAGGCGASGPHCINVHSAVESWNRRIPHRNGCACAACRAKVM